MFKNLKAVLIDFDGTLVDSHPILFEAYSKVMHLHGLTPSKEEFESLNGPSLYEIVQILKQKYGLQPSVQELYVTYRHMLGLIYASQIQLFPGALNFLESLKKRNLKVAVVTSSTRDLVDRVFSRLSLKNLFDEVFTSDLVERGKPNPDLYLLALEKLKLKADEAIAIEDSASGLKAAQSAHLYTLFFKPRKEGLQSHNSSSIKEVGSWDEIFQLLERECYGRRLSDL